YLDELIVYNKNLLNRNAMLKLIAERGSYDPELLSVLDDQLVESGQKIFEKRKDFMEVFIPVFQKHYQYLTEDAEQAELKYESPLFENDFHSLLRSSVE